MDPIGISLTALSALCTIEAGVIGLFLRSVVKGDLQPRVQVERRENELIRRNVVVEEALHLEQQNADKLTDQNRMLIEGGRLSLHTIQQLPQAPSQGAQSG